MLGLGTVSLMGIPGFGGDDPPSGAIAGVVADEAGEPVADATVALFDAADLRLVELTHTDAEGRFAFQQSPWTFHVFARPGGDPASATGRLGAWLLERERGLAWQLELTLPRGAAVTVRARDEDGRPVAGAEVRAYETRAGGPAVVARAQTDADGVAEVLCPETAHLGVFGQRLGRLAAWRFDLRAAPEGQEIEVVLPRGHAVEGRVTDEVGAAIDDVLVSSWDERGAWQWNGYARTAEGGRFTLLVAAKGGLLRAVDRAQNFLPAERRVDPGETPFADLVLATGRRVDVRCTDATQASLPARVWIWDESAQAWGWGSATDADGLLRARTSGHHRFAAEPLSGPPAPNAEWQRSELFEGVEELRRVDPKARE
jgi:protocatechuate 3,4-dioxygenase beta subunit